MPKISSPRIFLDLIKEFSYKGKDYSEVMPLTNITFFLGAGFSKAWDEKYPVADELFSFKLFDESEILWQFGRSIGYSTLEKIDFNIFRDIVYNIGMQKKYESIRSRYADQYNLELVELELNRVIKKNFEKFVKLKGVKDKTEKLKFGKLNDNQKEIISFFSWLQDHSTGDRGMPEGLRVHYISTNYDFVIETILDTILSDDDSHLNYVYRGFTPWLINKFEPSTTVHTHWLNQSLIKLNGGFEVFKSDSNNKYEIDYTTRSPLKSHNDCPTLIVPSKEQDYTADYFKMIFPKAIRLLQESKMLVIVGSSLPNEDALLRLLLRQFAEESIDYSQKIIFYIDLLDEKKQECNLINIFPYLKSDYEVVKFPKILFKGSFTEWVKKTNRLIKREDSPFNFY